MRNVITISLPPALTKGLDASAKRQGKTRSQLVQGAIKRQLFADELAEARALALPLARKQGYFTDEDIFKAVS